MHRIGIDERRSRLVRRHRIHPGERAGSALETARSLVALHSTDAVTVFLSVQARTTGVAPEDIERELYDERTLVRMLGMRGTLFVVSRDLVPVVQAACSTTIEARQRRRLEQWIAESGISSRPAAWLDRASNAALQALEQRGEAFTVDLAKTVPLLAKRLRLAVGTRWETTQSAGARVLLQLAMQGRVSRGRPRGTWVNGQYRWVPTVTWLGHEIERLDPARCTGRASEALVGDLRAWNRNGYPLVDRLDGA